MAEFERRRLASDNRMDVTQISDAAMSSDFQSPQAFDTWLHRAFGADMKLLTFAQRHARRTVELCPLQGEGYVYLADLCFLNQAPRAAIAAFVDQGLRVRPYDRNVLYRAGRQELLSGRHDAAIEFWSRCFNTPGPHQQQIVFRLVYSGMPARMLLNKLEPEWQTLREVWDQYCRSGTPQDLIDVLSYASEMAPLEIANEQSPVRPAYVWYRLASMNADVGRVDESLGCLERADECDPVQYAIRFALGKTLIAVGRLPEAEPHVRWCLARRPGDKNLSDCAAGHLETTTRDAIYRAICQCDDSNGPRASPTGACSCSWSAHTGPAIANGIPRHHAFRGESPRFAPTGGSRRGLFSALCRLVLRGVSASLRWRTAVLVEEVYFATLLWVVVIKLVAFCWFRLHQGWTRDSSFHDLVLLGQAVTTGSLAVTLFDAMCLPQFTIPRSVIVIDWGTTLLAAGAIGALPRLLSKDTRQFFARRGPTALVVGASDSGTTLLRAIRYHPHINYRVVGFIDDRPEVQRCRIEGVPVIGTCDDLPRLVQSHRVDEVLITSGELPGSQVRRLVETSNQHGFHVKVLPSYEQLLDGRVAVQPRAVAIEDLLGRPSVEIDLDGVRDWITGRTVMVTGSAGTIGSEICRQVLKLRPAMLVLVDRNETGQFFLERELNRLAANSGLQHSEGSRDRGLLEWNPQSERSLPAVAGNPKLDTRIDIRLADLTDQQRLAAVFSETRPDIIFHAAAYKHVPLMESHCGEAVKNIVLATRNLVDLADVPSSARAGHDLDRQGRESHERHGLLQAAGRAICAGPLRRFPVPLRHRALRQRAGFVGQRRADLSRADRPRRAGDRDASRHHALLHAHSRSGAARDPGRRDGAGRRNLRPRHGRAGPHSRPGPRHDPTSPDCASATTSKCKSSACARARSCTKSSTTRAESHQRTTPSQDHGRARARREFSLKSLAISTGSKQSSMSRTTRLKAVLAARSCQSRAPADAVQRRAAAKNGSPSLTRPLHAWPTCACRIPVL